MNNNYEREYSEDNYWEKLKTSATKAGHSVVYASLLLYFVLQKKDTPIWAKTVIIGALGYFIMPLDLVPDFTPVVGYSDDLGALALALMHVAVCIDEDVKNLAKSKMKDWFGDDFDTTEVDDKLK